MTQTEGAFRSTPSSALFLRQACSRTWRGFLEAMGRDRMSNREVQSTGIDLTSSCRHKVTLQQLPLPAQQQRRPNYQVTPTATTRVDKRCRCFQETLTFSHSELEPHFSFCTIRVVQHTWHRLLPVLVFPCISATDIFLQLRLQSALHAYLEIIQAKEYNHNAFVKYGRLTS